jgi:hypothetical protein
MAAQRKPKEGMGHAPKRAPKENSVTESHDGCPLLEAKRRMSNFHLRHQRVGELICIKRLQLSDHDPASG